MPEKKEFRKRGIISHYDLFKHTLEILLKESLINEKIKIIDGNRDHRTIHREIKNELLLS